MNAPDNYNELLKHFYQYSQNSSYLLSFEGIEGSGKSTQIKLLEQYLKSKGYNVLTLREPGGTQFGENLRRAILESDAPLHPLAEAHLFASSRAQLLYEQILPVLNQKNQIVILDRYIDSSISYQGVARDLGIETILNIHRDKPLNILPNLTFYLQIPLETSIERQRIRNNEKDYFEKENMIFYQKLVDGFESCAQIFPNRIKTVDATTDIESIQKQIQHLADQLL